MPASASSLRLTPRQQLVWLENRLHPGVPLNMVTTLLEIGGDINAEAFCRAFECVVQRHDALRMTLESGGAAPRLHVSESIGPCIDFIDLCSADLPSFDGWLKARLSNPPPANLRLFDAALVKKPEGGFAFVLNRRHINSDNASSIMLHNELEAHYLEIVRGSTDRSDLSLLSRGPSYARYLSSGAAYEFSEDAKASEAFWKRRNATTPPSLRFYGADPRVRSALYARVSRTLSAELGRSIENLHATAAPSLIFITTLFAFLRRATGNDDICIGVPLHNRTDDTARLIGLIMNICPNRIRFGPSDTLEDLLGKVRQEIDQVRPHRRHTVSSRQAGFEVLFNFLPDVPASFGGHKASYVHTSPLALLETLGSDDSGDVTWRDREKLGLTVLRAEGASTYELHFDFNRSVFPGAALRERAADHFLAVLAALLAEPAQTIDSIDILAPQERSRLFSQAMAPETFHGPTVVDLFEAEASSTPDKTAIEGPAGRLTYRQLEAEVKALAACLQAAGAGGGMLVAICLDRSPRMIVALLAVLRTGGAYVPIDPRLPDDQIDLILEATEPLTVLSEAALRSRFRGGRSSRIIDLDDIRSGALEELRGHRPAPHDLAYMIFTSGSTGQPKAVPITHAQLSEFLAAMRDRIGINPADRMLAATTIAFDPHTVEIFLPLIMGGCVVLAPGPGSLGARTLAQLIDDHAVTIVQGTPSLFRMMLASGWEGNSNLAILCGGEVLSLSLGRALRERSRTLWNLYGPTETTVWATARKVIASEGEMIPVGTPLPGVKIYVLTPTLAPTPIGVPGEIYIGGARVARGYFARAELTREKFLPDPFSPDPNALMYRTGDFGRFRDDLELEFIGRVDNQVKIRGFRVELEEIEAHAVQHRSIAACVAAPYSDGSGETAISVCVELAKPDGAVDRHEFLSFLRGRLPDYMMPSRILVVDLLPRSPIGKIDRQGLEELTATPMLAPEQPRDDPASELEERVLAIWRRLLNADDLGVSDNFFDAGGHSILAMALMLEIESELGIETRLETIFERPTVRKLCSYLAEFSHPATDSTGHRQKRWAGDVVFESRPAVISPLKPASSEKTLYFAQSGFDFSALSDALAGDIATASVAINGPSWLQLLIGGRDIAGAIDRISEVYAEAIVATHRSGPLFLAGHSFGGILAVETGARLDELGAAPETIFVFDSELHAYRHRTARLPFRNALNRFAGFSIFGRLGGKRRADLGAIFAGLCEEASLTYRGPRRSLASPVVLFGAGEASSGGALQTESHLGWAEVLKANLTLIPTPGDDWGLLKADDVGGIAGELNRRIDGVSSTQ